jgi:hypothetical protein
VSGDDAIHDVGGGAITCSCGCFPCTEDVDWSAGSAGLNLILKLGWGSEGKSREEESWGETHDDYLRER